MHQEASWVSEFLVGHSDPTSALLTPDPIGYAFSLRFPLLEKEVITLYTSQDSRVSKWGQTGRKAE